VLTWQCCGQQPVLHDCESDTTDVEHEPPHDGGEIERERDCEPPPHGAEHEPHADQPPIEQSAGQQCVLQSSLWYSPDSEHEPPHEAGVIEREREREPPPHPAEQPDQLLQPLTAQLTAQQPASQGRDSLK
jgi:hypothetical protein